MATFHEIRTPDAEDPFDEDRLPPGPRAAMWGLLGVIAVIAIPYAASLASDPPAGGVDGGMAESLAALRPWTPEDPIPFSNNFQPGSSGPVVAEAGGGAGRSHGPAGGGPGDAGGVEGLAGLVDPDMTAKPVSLVAAPDTQATDTGGAAHVSDRDDVVDGGEADTRAGQDAGTPVKERPRPDWMRLAIPDATWDGFTEEITDPDGAMGAFYDALIDTALKKDGRITRIAQWGDSAIAADGMPSTARQLLQRQFGDAGHGFSLVTAGNPWYKRKDIQWTQKGWKAQEFIRKQAPDGRYGYGGVAAAGYQGARAQWQTMTDADAPVGKAARRFTVMYSRERGGGNLQVSVDGQEQVVIDTRAAKGEPATDEVKTIVVEDGPHSFKIRNTGGGKTRVFGVAVERDGPGVVYDSLGIIGARAARQLNIDDAHFEAQLKLRKPDLIVLMYGGNALPDSTPMEKYKAKYKQVIARYRRALPKASCVVLSPLDHGERHRGRIRTVKRMYLLMEAQKAVALQSGCAWFSLFEAMGGEGSVGRWFNASPKLAASDLAHPTGRGAKVLGTLWYKAIMKGLAGHLKAKRAAWERAGEAPKRDRAPKLDRAPKRARAPKVPQ